MCIMLSFAGGTIFEGFFGPFCCGDSSIGVSMGRKTSSGESYLIATLASLIDGVKPYFLKRHECTKIVDFDFQIATSKCNIEFHTVKNWDFLICIL